MSNATATANVEVEPLFVRTIANALERYMDKREDGRVHWAKPAGNEVDWGPAKLTWPNVDDSYLSFVVSQGSNEGYLVWVCHQEAHYGTEGLKALMVIKCLCCHAEAFNQARLVMEFLKKMDLAELRADQK